MHSEAEAHQAPEVVESAPSEDVVESIETPLPTSDVAEAETASEEVATTPEPTPDISAVQDFESQLNNFLSAPEIPAGLDAAVADENAEEVVQSTETVEEELKTEPVIDQAEVPVESELEEVTPETPEPESTESKPPQYRFRPRSKEAELAYQFLKEDKYLSEPEAFARAHKELHPEPEVTEVTQETPEATQQTAPEVPEEFLNQTSQELQASINEMEAESLETLEGDYDVEAYAKRQKEILKLKQVRSQRVMAESNYQNQVEQSMLNVVSKYPVAKDPESAFSKRVSEVYSLWQDMRDPRASDPAAPEIIAALVAKEQNVSDAPAIPDQEPVATPAVAPPVPQSQVPRKVKAAPSVAPVSGANRTQTAQSQLSAALSQVNDPESFEALKEALIQQG